MKKFCVCVLAFITLSGCQEDGNKPLPEHENAAHKTALSFLNQPHNAWPSGFSSQHLTSLVESGDVVEASRYVNAALNKSPQHAGLHIANGFVYELMQKSEDDLRRELVTTAYRSAYNIDPSQWISAYLLGVSELKEKKFSAAQEHLAHALVLNPNQADIAYALAYASYYTKDIDVALASLKRAMKSDKNRPEFVRSAVLMYAASGQFSSAKQYFEQYKKLLPDEVRDHAFVEQRMQDWQKFHQQKPLRTVGAAMGAEGIKIGKDERLEDFTNFQKDQESARTDNRQQEMIAFDCMILRTHRITRAQQGQNIFNHLTVILGNTKEAGSSFDYSRTTERATSPWNVAKNPITGQWSTNLQFALALKDVVYGLNIMNAYSTDIELVDRVCASTLISKPVFFVEGQQFTGASSGFITTSQLTLDVGTSLQVNPISLNKDGLVVMEVKLSGSLFPGGGPNVASGISSQVIVLSRAQVNTTVQGYLGETIILACLYSRANTAEKSGFPVLQDIPLLQYFTSESRTEADARCILYMITPRLAGNHSYMARKPQARTVAKLLQSHGLMSIGEYSTLYYVIKNLKENAEMFANFRPGDLAKPYWGREISFKERLKMIASFLWY